jgi:hypothetical protein
LVGALSTSQALSSGMAQLAGLLSSKEVSCASRFSQDEIGKRKGGKRF